MNGSRNGDFGGMSPRRILAKALEVASLARTDPRAALGAVERAVGIARSQVVLRGCHRGSMICTAGEVRVRGARGVHLGSRLFFLPGVVATEILCHPGAELVIGDDTGFNGGVFLEAFTSLRIGARCLFGSMVRVADRSPAAEGPVVIGDDVWVAHGATIEPGVTIGSGAAVSAGSVVTKDVPPGFLAIGNPARNVRLSLLQDRSPL